MGTIKNCAFLTISYENVGIRTVYLVFLQILSRIATIRKIEVKKSFREQAASHDGCPGLQKNTLIRTRITENLLVNFLTNENKQMIPIRTELRVIKIP